MDRSLNPDGQGSKAPKRGAEGPNTDWANDRFWDPRISKLN